VSEWILNWAGLAFEFHKFPFFSSLSR
jgi:hypothetical protein